MLEADQAALEQIYFKSAIKRAKEISDSVASIGAYTHPKGIPLIREHVAQFIERRDGFPSDPEMIFLTDGASEGIKKIFSVLITEGTGVMLPSPQYPMYGAAVTVNGGAVVPYNLDPRKDWDFDVTAELNSALEAANKDGIRVRALCLINPGNPTGHIFPDAVLQDLVKFCSQNNIVLIADEVYQSNYFDTPAAFSSAKKIACQLGLPIQLFSIHSVSKGYLGECGRRGGYFECYGIDEAVVQQLYKLACMSLGSNADGQAMVDLMVNPPKPEDDVYETFYREASAVRDSLCRRSIKVTETLNSLPGIWCSPAEGASDRFPQLTLPQAFIDEATSQGQLPDVYYCLRLLESTGLCVVPGSGFGMPPGQHHFRMTILPPEDELQDVLDRLSTFHLNLMSRYSQAPK